MTAKPGFIWTFEHYTPDGVLVETKKNIMPLQGLNHWIDVLLGKTTQHSQWYMGLFSGAYTPLASDTASAFPAAATEFTAYSGNTRKSFVVSSAYGGVSNNDASPAEFEFTSNGTIYGGFLASASGKNATTGILLSAVRFDVPKPKEPTDILRVRAELGLISE